MHVVYGLDEAGIPHTCEYASVAGGNEPTARCARVGVWGYLQGLVSADSPDNLPDRFRD